MEDKLTSLFDLPTLQDVSLETDDHSIHIEGTQPDPTNCPRCNGIHLHRKTRNNRFLRLPPLGGKTVTLLVFVQKRECVSCKYSWWPQLSFVTGRKRVTNSFTSYALELLRFGTIKDVGQHLGVGWDLIKGIHKDYLLDMYRDIDMSEVEYVSIDEFSIAKGHKYMTIVMDNRTGRILHAVEGRKKQDIKPALEELKKKHPSLKLLQWT